MKAGAVIVRFLRFVLLSLSALKMRRWLFDRTELLPVEEDTEFRLLGFSIDKVRFVCSPSAAQPRGSSSTSSVAAVRRRCMVVVAPKLEDRRFSSA